MTVTPRAFSRHRRRRCWSRLLLAGLLVIGGAAWAGYDRQAAIIVRALAYDYNLKERAGDSLVIAVLYKEGDGESATMADAWVKAFDSLSGVKVAGLPMSAIKMPFANAASLKAAIASKGIDVLFVSVGLDAEVGAIKDLSHALKVLTVGGKEAFVTQGLTLGVFAAADQSTIEVNLEAAGQENVSFSSDLLKHAKVIR